MRRRTDPDGDSLELLLDTICNMFGTIMFVTLIAALLALVSRREQAEESIAVIDSERQREVERLQRLEVQLSNDLESRPAPDADPETDAAVDRVARAIGEIARREEIIASYQRALEAAREGTGEVGRQVEPLRAEVDRLEDAIESTGRAQNRKLRTPLEREVNLEPYVIVLWQDRLYPLCDWSNRSVDGCERLRQWHNQYTFASRCTTRGRCDANGLRLVRSIPLRAGSGIPVGDAGALRQSQEYQALLRSLDPGRDLIVLVVDSDSFDSFAAAKEAFLSAGFNYSLDISSSDLPAYEDSWVNGVPTGL
jgi:hypothetical protein